MCLGLGHSFMKSQRKFLDPFAEKFPAPPLAIWGEGAFYSDGKDSFKTLLSL